MGTRKVEPKISNKNKITRVTGELRDGMITASTMFVAINKVQFKNYKFVSKDEEESYKAGWRAGIRAIINRTRLCKICEIDAKRVQDMAKKKGGLRDGGLQRTKL